VSTERIHVTRSRAKPGGTAQSDEGVIPFRSRKPPWLKVKAPGGPSYRRIEHLMRSKSLHTVCEEANCPNIGECWERGTATFMILGDVCTRRCGFCNVKSGVPDLVDRAEPLRVAHAVKQMGLRHCVVTSVPLARVIDARPDVFNHNVETVPRLYPKARRGSNFLRSCRVLQNARHMDADVVTKSGLMVGLGETMDEMLEAFALLREHEVQVLTVGQYLRPSENHLPLVRYWTPDEFAELEREAYAMGFESVASGPLVRSSYHADEQVPVRRAQASA
jgi:lipoyl synthase